MSQQISVALGVAVAGMILEAFTYITGQPLGAPAFSTAFMIVASITALAAIPFMRLARRRRQLGVGPGNPPA